MKFVASDNDDASQASQSLLDSSQMQQAASVEFEYHPPNKTKKIETDGAGKISDADLYAAKSARQLAQVNILFIIYLSGYFQE